jgi:hypothetical protein
LMLVMRDLMARRSEAAALMVEHLTFAEDGSATALIARSKTDQEGAGVAGCRRGPLRPCGPGWTAPGLPPVQCSERSGRTAWRSRHLSKQERLPAF